MIGDLGLLALPARCWVVFLGTGPRGVRGVSAGRALRRRERLHGQPGPPAGPLLGRRGAFGELLAGALVLVGLLMPVGAALDRRDDGRAIAKVHGPKGFSVRTAATSTTWCSSSRRSTLAPRARRVLTRPHLLSR